MHLDHARRSPHKKLDALLAATLTVWSLLLLSSVLNSTSVRTPTMPLATLSGCAAAPVLQSASAWAQSTRSRMSHPASGEAPNACWIRR